MNPLKLQNTKPIIQNIPNTLGYTIAITKDINKGNKDNKICLTFSFFMLINLYKYYLIPGLYILKPILFNNQKQTIKNTKIYSVHLFLPA